MKQVSRHFALRPAVDAGCERSLLDTLDNALRAVCAGQRDAAQREALAALTGMRRDLFPKAAAYAPSLATAL
jgi:ABC-type arginine transport system permease subunit